MTFSKQRVDFNWSPENLTERLAIGRLIVIGSLMLVSMSVHGADKLNIRINNQTISMYRTADLAHAINEAATAHKPIAWIASSPKLLDGKGTISLPNSRGATLHALFELKDNTVLVFMDAYEENHKVLKLVDDALHTPDPHYMPPTVVFLDPKAKRVLATVIYESDYVKRSKALAKALDDIKGKF
jgi:hypothetical protein